MLIPPKSPWMVGAMEAVVKITKRCLKAVVNDRLLHEEALHALLLEIESIVNSRPLTSVSENTNDLEPLTPNRILIGQSSPNTNFANITEKNVSSRAKWKSVQAVAKMYWKRWITKYLPLLKLQNKWTKHRGSLKIGTQL